MNESEREEKIYFTDNLNTSKKNCEKENTNKRTSRCQCSKTFLSSCVL